MHIEVCGIYSVIVYTQLHTQSVEFIHMHIYVYIFTSESRRKNNN